MAKYMGSGLDNYERRTGPGANRSTPEVSESDMRVAYGQICGKARLGLGIDGMPLKKGQTGPQIDPEEDPIDARISRLEAERYKMVRDHRSGKDIMAVCDEIAELRRQKNADAGR